MFKLNKFFKINNLNREAGKVILIKFGVLIKCLQITYYLGGKLIVI